MNKSGLKVAAGIVALLSTVAWAAPISSAARTVIPSDVQQIISLDYRLLKTFDTALALKEQVLPDNLRQFESALKSIDIDPNKDLESLTFASFRNGEQGLQTIGVASGSFSSETVLKKMRLQQAVKSVKYHNSDLYSISGGMAITFLNDSTLLFGNDSALRAALNAHDGNAPALESNRSVTDMIGPVEKATVWGVFDQQGTQNLLLSALGGASKLPRYGNIKNRVLGSRYAMNFRSGLKFRLDVLTSDSSASAELRSLLKMGVLYKKLTATPEQKLALGNMTVDSASSNLQMYFRTDHKQFEDLLRSQFFAAVSR